MTTQKSVNNFFQIERQREAETLDNLYKKSFDETTYVIISGNAGVGKSYLVESCSWKEGDVSRNNYFVSGKFDSNFEFSEPYLAISVALTSLCKLWSSTEKGLAEIRSFLTSNNRDKHVLKKFLPHLYEATCNSTSTNMKTDHMETVHGTNSFQCLNVIIYKLIKEFTAPPRQVVICLDDIQWADQASLDLINFLVSENLKGVFFVCTYRGEECDLHVFNHYNDLIQKKETLGCVHNIHLSDFSLAQVNNIFSKFVKKDLEETLPLVEVIHEKTGGNPLFVDQFLQLLQKDGYLRYSFLKDKWEWSDISEIRQAMSIVSNNVAEVIASSIQLLDHDIKEVLKVASCLGSQLPVHIIDTYLAAKSDGNKHVDTNVILEDQVHNQIMKKLNDHGFELYMWAHDRIHQATYSLIPDHEKNILHLTLGNLILKMTTDSSVPDVLVYIAVNQLNRVPISEIMSQNNGEIMLHDLACLNLQAAKLSMSKSAFHSAVNFLSKGISLLDENTMWTDQYETCLNLFNNLIHAEYTIGNHDNAQVAIKMVLKNANSLEDKLEAQAIQCDIIVSGKDRDTTSGITMCLDVLKSLGMSFPKKSNKLHILIEKRSMKKSLPNERLECVLHKPIMEDKKELGASLILGKLVRYLCLTSSFALLELVAMRSLRYSANRGLSVHTSMFMASFAFLYRQKGQNLKAVHYSSLAEDVLKRCEKTSDNAMIGVIIHSSIIPLIKPLQDSLRPFLECYKTGIQTGNMEFAFIASMSYGYNYLLVGLPLAPLAKDMEGYEIEARQFGIAPSIQTQFPIIQQTAMNLQGKSYRPTFLKGDAMDQDEMLNQVEGSAKSMTCRDICIFRLMLAYVYQDMDAAKTIIDELSKFPVFNPSIVRVHFRQIFTGLAAFRLFRETKKKKYAIASQEALGYFKDAVKKGSMNAYPMYLLLVAEDKPCKENYDKAISVCSRSGVTNFIALSNECAALYFLEQGDEDWGMFYMEKSQTSYQEWGAYGKVKMLQKEYLCLASEKKRKSNENQKVRWSKYDINQSMIVSESVRFSGKELSGQLNK